jgi:hypothetical protein
VLFAPQQPLDIAFPGSIMNDKLEDLKKLIAKENRETAADKSQMAAAAAKLKAAQAAAASTKKELGAADD